jgi:hypothetical protein
MLGPFVRSLLRGHRVWRIARCLREALGIPASLFVRHRANGQMSLLQSIRNEPDAQVRPRSWTDNQLPVVRKTRNDTFAGCLCCGPGVSGRPGGLEVRIVAARWCGGRGRHPDDGSHSNLPRSSRAKRYLSAQEIRRAEAAFQNIDLTRRLCCWSPQERGEPARNRRRIVFAAILDPGQQLPGPNTADAGPGSLISESGMR